MNDSDEEIIATTMSELSLILILLFFLYIGAALANMPVEIAEKITSPIVKLTCPIESEKNENKYSEILFESGKSKLPAEKSCINNICAKIYLATKETNTGVLISFTGHSSKKYDYTKKCGTKYECNLELSRSRSDNIKQHCTKYITKLLGSNRKNIDKIENKFVSVGMASNDIIFMDIKDYQDYQDKLEDEVASRRVSIYAVDLPQ